VSSAKEISPDDAKLRELGFDPGASAPDALAKLRELRTNAAASPLAIARALGAIADPGAAAMLVEMEAGASGALRREIRRSIFKLRQRGVEVHEPVREPSKAPAPAPSDAGLSAFMSPIDAEGAQIVWLVKARPQGGVLRLWALISEDEGLAGVQNHSLTRREFKTQREELEKQASVKLIEIDARLADFIVCDAYRRTPESRRGQVGNFYALRTEVTGAPPPTDYQNPIYSHLAAEAAAEPSADLMKEPEIAEIRIPVEQLKPYVDEVNRAQESVLVVSRASQSERIMGAVEKAIAELLSGERAQLLRRRLEITAEYLLKTGRRQAAGWAVAAAARIRDGAELKQVAFFRTLVQAQLAALIAQETERKQEEPRLIVTPAEAMRAQQERQSRMRGPRR
jgi:hypothetical protein